LQLDQLDQHYLDKAQEAFVRSRARWIESGENYYFFSIEKCRQKNCISSLLVNGKESKDSKIIENKVYLFTLN